MANGSDSGPLVGRGVDYKTLFMVSVGLVGALAGIWLRAGDREVSAIKQSNDRQWERISDINNRLLEYGVEVRQLKRETEDQEIRIRALERELNHRH